METPKKQFSFYLNNKPTLVVLDWFSLYNRYNKIDLQLFFNYLKGYKDIYQIRFYQGTIQEKDWSVKLIESARSIGYEVVTKLSKYIRIEIKKEKHLEVVMRNLQTLLDDIGNTNNKVAGQIYTIKTKINERLANGIDVQDLFNFIDEIDEDIKGLGVNINSFRSELEKPIRKPKCDFDAEIAKDVILDIDKYDNLILFSGDGDFASTVEYLVTQKNKTVFVMYPQGSFGETDYRNFNLIKLLADKRREYKKGFICRPVDHILQNIVKKEPADFSAGPDTNNIAKTDVAVNS